jgi:hypothetical protein
MIGIGFKKKPPCGGSISFFGKWIMVLGLERQEQGL